MYCPNCAAPIDGVKFCRACGANVSLVPQALSGQLEERAVGHDAEGKPYDRHGRRRRKPPSLEAGIRQIFMGLGFLIVAFAVKEYAPAGAIWWFWMLLPAFSMLGNGVAEIVRFKQSQSSAPLAPSPAVVPPAPRTNELPPRPRSEIAPPASVTEDTTRRIEAPAEHPQKTS
jgi:hypothetical protein